MSVFRSELFKNKVAIVTGGGTGIGKAITEELVTLGCRVMIASRKQDRLTEAANALDPKGSVVKTSVCNIRKEEDVKTLVANSLKEFGRIDYLINNGGGQFPQGVADMTLKGWNAVIDTNLTGTFLVCREVYKQYMEQHGGVIVNIVADMFRGFPFMAHTGAARSAVDNLTKSLSVEWAENGIRVNAVAPGIIYSETARNNYGEYNPFELARPGIPAKRLGDPQEVSSAVCFLLSPGASFISGETLKVDCGSSLYSPLYWKIPEHSKLPAYKWTYKPPKNIDDGTTNGPKSKL